MTPQLFVVDGGGEEEDETPALFEDLPPDPVSESQARSSTHGKEFDVEALEFVEGLGAEVVERGVLLHGYRLDALVQGANGRRFLVQGHGTPDRTDRRQAGMRRTDTMLKFGFKALRLAQRGCPHPLILLTSHLPRAGSSSAFYLSELNDVLLDAVAVVEDLRGQQRLQHYFTTDGAIEPLDAPWRAVQLGFDFEEGSDDA
jgi:hypothetical protein